MDKWYDLPSVIYTAEHIVTDDRCIKVIRDMNISEDISKRNRTICCDDAYFETPDENYFRQVWYARHPDAEMIPNAENELCIKKAHSAYMESPFAKLSELCSSCAEKAHCLELANDIIRNDEFKTVIEEMNDYYTKLFA